MTPEHPHFILATRLRLDPNLVAWFRYPDWPTHLGWAECENPMWDPLAYYVLRPEGQVPHEILFDGTVGS